MTNTIVICVWNPSKKEKTIERVETEDILKNIDVVAEVIVLRLVLRLGLVIGIEIGD